MPGPQAQDSPDTLGQTHARRPRWVRIALAVAMLVLLAATTAYGYTVVQTRLEAARQIDRATELLKAADETVTSVDDVVRAEVTSEVATQATSLVDDLKATRESLGDAAELIDEARPGLNDEDRERAQVLKDVAEARGRMLEVARPILEANARAATALPLAQDAWDRILSAEQRADEATTRYNTLTKAGVQDSSQLNEKAEIDLKEARKGFEEAAEAYQELEVDAYVAYIDGKLGLVALSRQSDTAVLAGDPNKANKLAAAYNDAEKKVVVLAKELPASPDEFVARAYVSDVATAVATYFEARSLASEADEELRRF